jgi:hypothetical protein
MDRQILTKDGVEYYGNANEFTDEHDHIRMRRGNMEERIYKSNISKDLSVQPQSSGGGCLVLMVFSSAGILALIGSLFGLYYYV